VGAQELGEEAAHLRVGHGALAAWAWPLAALDSALRRIETYKCPGGGRGRCRLQRPAVSVSNSSLASRGQMSPARSWGPI
jgi:hypothetical protein